MVTNIFYFQEMEFLVASEQVILKKNYVMSNIAFIGYIQVCQCQEITGDGGLHLHKIHESDSSLLQVS